MGRKVKLPNGGTVECESYLGPTVHCCATCRFWNGCRIIETNGSHVLGVGFDKRQNLGACGAKNNARVPARSSCPKWVGLR